jgi:hypothetical protein
MTGCYYIKDRVALPSKIFVQSWSNHYILNALDRALDFFVFREASHIAHFCCFFRSFGVNYSASLQSLKKEIEKA